MTGFTAPEFSSELSAAIATKYALPIELANVLLARGFEDGEALGQFLEKPRHQIEYTEMLESARTAAEAISNAVDKGKSVLVYGDYDVDGVAAAAIMLGALREIRASANAYLPSRFGEGYGVAEEVLVQAKAQGYGTIVTVDCGISAAAEIEKAKEIGLEVIVTDHHEPPETLPRAVIVNPLLDAEWMKRTNHNLSGAAVSLAVAAELFRLRGHSIDRLYDRALEFVALATIADVMELIGVNRALVHHGLEQMWDTVNPGLRALLENFGLDAGVVPSAEQLAFSVIPALNACGRMHSPKIALNLFTAENRDEARILAAKVRELNNMRRQVQDRVFDEAAPMAVEEGDASALVLYDKDWHAGILGIVAAKVSEVFGRPALILSSAHGDDGTIRGSARGPAGFNLREAIGRCSSLLIKFGGHTTAAGVVLNPDNLDGFKSALLAETAKGGGDFDMPSARLADAKASVNALSSLDVTQLSRLEPFGHGNPAPKFLIENVELQNARAIGRDGTTISAVITGSEAGIRAVGFRKSHLLHRIKIGQRYNVLATAAVDSYNGVRRVRIAIEDVEDAALEV